MPNGLAHDIINTNRIRVVLVVGLSIEGDAFSNRHTATIELHANNFAMEQTCDQLDIAPRV